MLTKTMVSTGWNTGNLSLPNRYPDQLHNLYIWWQTIQSVIGVMAARVGGSYWNAFELAADLGGVKY